MMVLSFSHYNLRAPQDLLETLRSFYVEVVGLRVGERPPFTSFGHWLYAGQKDVLHLTEARDADVRSIETTTTFDHAAFNCEGRKRYESTLAQRGIKYEAVRVPQTGQVQLFFKDPAGNGVELNFEGADA